MSLPIRTQMFVVEVSASIMPAMTEAELTDIVTRLAVQKESQHGMGYIGITVRETADSDPWGYQ